MFYYRKLHKLRYPNDFLLRQKRRLESLEIRRRSQIDFFLLRLNSIKMGIDKSLIDGHDAKREIYWRKLFLFCFMAFIWRPNMHLG